MTCRRVILSLVVAGLSACVTTDQDNSRARVLSQTLTSTVQIFDIRQDGGNRAGSGVALGPGTELGQTLILTTKHFLEPITNHTAYVMDPLRTKKVNAQVVAISADSDLAILSVSGLSLTPVVFKSEAQLGDEVWVVAFPWGRRRTVVSGIVSQISWGKDQPSEVPIKGAVSLIDASVSYGTSGGGVFDANDGGLHGIVSGYRSAELSLPGNKEVSIKLPVAGETTVIATTEILRFLKSEKIEIK